jgi:hypothetical protein
MRGGLHLPLPSLYSDGTLNHPLHHVYNTLSDRKRRHKSATFSLPLTKTASRMHPPSRPSTPDIQSKWKAHVACFLSWAGPTLFSLSPAHYLVSPYHINWRHLWKGLDATHTYARTYTRARAHTHTHTHTSNPWAVTRELLWANPLEYITRMM